MEHVSITDIAAVFQLLAVIGTILGVIWAFRGRLDGISSSVSAAADRLASVEIEMKQITAVLVELGRQDERLNSLDRTVQMTGSRVDEVVVRLNKFADGK